MPKKSKFELIIPDEDDTSFFGKEYLNLGEVNNEIEKLESSIPDKRTKEYETWKTKINFLIDIYNKLAHFKSFKKYE